MCVSVCVFVIYCNNLELNRPACTKQKKYTSLVAPIAFIEPLLRIMIISCSDLYKSLRES